jgi:hypothetical protein
MGLKKQTPKLFGLRVWHFSTFQFLNKKLERKKMPYLLCLKVWNELKEIDYKLALNVRGGGCPYCKGILDWACFPRKPRGIEDLENERRISFCCRSCRKRVTPASVRFLWKKVYVLLAVALEPERKMIGVCSRTVARWIKFWAKKLSIRSPFCVRFRYLLPVDFAFSLQSMISSFIKNGEIQFLSMAKFLRPLGCAPNLRYGDFRAEDAC